MFKDFFLKEVNWSFPWKEKATKASQWYTFIVCMAGVYALSYWITTTIMSLTGCIFEKNEDNVMGEETE